MRLLITVLATTAAFAQSYTQEEKSHSFGRLSLEAPAEHDFVLTNTGQQPLKVLNVQLTPPLVLAKMKSSIQPGEIARFTVRISKPRELGRFEGDVLINFETPRVPPAVFRIHADIQEPVEFRPARAVYVATNRGTPKTTSIEIINHEAEPLSVTIASAGANSKASIETLVPGKHFRLSIELTGEGPAGKRTEELTLATSHRNYRTVPIQVNSLLNERVYTFPPDVDLGRIRTMAIKAKPQMAAAIQSTMMVYQRGGTDFQITAETDVPFLRLALEKSTKFGDRWQIRATLIPEKLKDGPVAGFVTIRTNDKEFPELKIPVSAHVDGSW